MAVILYEDTRAGLLGAIEFDVVSSENHDVSATATEHPVEKGAPISDHVRPNLIKISLEGVITNAPLIDAVIGSGQPGFPLQIRGIQTPVILIGSTKTQLTRATVRGGYTAPYKVNGFRTIHTPIETTPSTWGDVPFQVGGRSLQFPNTQDRVNAAYEILSGICQAGSLVTLSTKLKEYPEMVILSVKAPRTPEDCLAFQLEFQEARFVYTEEVDIVKRKAPAEKRAQATEEKGTTPVVDDFAEEENLPESVAYGVKN